MTQTPPGDAEEIVSFWTSAGRGKWWKKDDAFDAEIRERFLGHVLDARAGKLDRWHATPQGALAVMILLDQFPRNLFRGHADSFVADAYARDLADKFIAAGHDLAVEHDMRAFFYTPFEHSEQIADQIRSVVLFHAFGDREYLDYARIHHDIIARFGRFPHRNPVLGRATSAAERAFLDGGGFSA